VTRVVISPAAEHDLEHIWVTIAADNPPTATRILRAIGAKIGRLADHPRLGPRRTDIRPAARMLVSAVSHSVERIQPTKARSTKSRSSAL
jgi:toxin ParE1/3/4